MSLLYATAANVKIGAVVQWLDYRWIGQKGLEEPVLSGSPLRITRPAAQDGDWFGVRFSPEPWERDGQEWLIHRSQIAERKYAIVQDSAPAFGASSKAAEPVSRAANGPSEASREGDDRGREAE